MRRVLTVAAVALVILAGLVFLVTAGMGRPISTDLSVIGKGKPALVLVYENYSPTAGDALNRLSQVRDSFASRIEFVVADLGVPQGRAFADRHELDNGQAMFLTSEGRPLQAMNIPADEQELRSLLADKLAALE